MTGESRNKTTHDNSLSKDDVREVMEDTFKKYGLDSRQHMADHMYIQQRQKAERVGLYAVITAIAMGLAGFVGKAIITAFKGG